MKDWCIVFVVGVLLALSMINSLLPLPLFLTIAVILWRSDFKFSPPIQVAPITQKLAFALVALLIIAAVPLRADSLACWDLRRFLGRDLHGVDRFPDRWVVTGWDTISTSADGANWTDRYQADPDQLRQFAAAAQGNGVSVIVGWQINNADQSAGDASLAISDDGGNTWTTQPSGIYGDLVSIAFGNGVFVAVGGYGDQNRLVVYSFDGINWSQIDDGTPGFIVDIAFINGKFIAVGLQGAIITSTDGFSWEEQTSGTSDDLFAIAFGNGKYVVSGAQGIILTSTDAVNWAVGSSGQSANIFGLAYGAGQFVASPEAVGTILSSTDGVDWSVHKQSGGMFSAQRLVFGADTMMAVDYNARIWQSQTLSTGPLPIITLQPRDLVAPFNSDATFSVGAANCSPPQFQWFRNNAAIPGETRDQLVIKGVAPSDIASYYAVISDTFGSVTSRVARLTLQPPQQIDFWEWRSPLPQGNHLRAVTHANDRFVAVGEYGSVVVSQDALQWSDRGLESPYKLNSVAYGNGRFLAVGTASVPLPIYARAAVLTSSNALEWTELPSALNQAAQPNRVAFGNDTFVISASLSQDGSGHLLRSSDGAAWTDFPLPLSTSIFNLGFFQGLFVAVGIGPSSRAIILTSPDGVDWQQRFDSPTAAFTQITYGNGKFVAFGKPIGAPANAFIATSPDGLNWQSAGSNIILSDDLTHTAVAYNNGTFLLIQPIITGGLAVFTSPDAITWTPRDTAIQNLQLRALTTDGNQFVAAGNNGNLARSNDGINWTIQSAASDNNFRGVAYSNGACLAVGNGGAVALSLDGATWKTNLAANTGNLHGVTRGPDLWVAVGAQGAIATSPDGVAWTAQTSPVTDDLFEVVYAQGLYVAVGGVKVALSGNRYNIVTSPDGLNWSVASTGTGFRLHGLTFGQGQFVAVGQPGAIFTSTDGLVWQHNTGLGVQYLKSVAFGNGVFVTVGEAGPSQIFVSRDAQDWQQQSFSASLNSNPEFAEITFGDGQFLAVGDNGLIASTPDGLNWQQRHSPTDINLRSITFGLDSFVIVGNNQLILQSGFKSPVLTAIDFANDGFHFLLEGPAGASIDLQSATRISPPDWQTIRSFTLLSTRTNLVDPASLESPARFYRAIGR